MVAQLKRRSDWGAKATRCPTWRSEGLTFAVLATLAILGPNIFLHHAGRDPVCTTSAPNLPMQCTSNRRLDLNEIYDGMSHHD